MHALVFTVMKLTIYTQGRHIDVIETTYKENLGN